MKLARFKPVMRAVLALALLAISSAAMALGLGEIRVKSKPGEPLVAEIPVISSAPGELDQLRARLASPVIFERVGLARPSGLVSQLDFAVALSDDGKPVIRVTSQDPVDTPAVNFLIEVDWGQGRLVREYSALVGAPGSMAAAGQPAIQAPTPAPSSQIQRPQPAPVAAAARSDETPVGTTASTAVPATPAAPIAPSPAPADVTAQAGVPETVTVQQGQALSQIARGLEQGGTLDQTMMALLQANPEAFIGGNINRVRSGAVLRVPQAGQIQALAVAQAAAMVRQQVADWRQARQPIPQPANPAAEPQAPAAGTAPKVADARLEIAPPAADAAQRAGTTSGTDAGGEGDMLANEQLRQTREDLAARNAEVQELKAQVAELEKLKTQQAQLIAMKDSDLAAAQQRLGQTPGAQPGVPAWLWIGLALVVLGLGAWVVLRRRSGPRPVPVYKGPLVGPAQDAPAVPQPGGDTTIEETPVHVPEPTPEPVPRYSPTYVEPAAAPVRAADPAPAPATTPAWMSPTAKPTWHTPNAPQPTLAQIVPSSAPRPVASPTPSPAPAPAPETVETAVPASRWAPVRPADEANAPLPTPAAPSAGGRERLELAIAYLDLGDTEAARALLGQVAAGDDPQAAAEAAQLLGELD